jgi:hypothetical protein
MILEKLFIASDANEIDPAFNGTTLSIVSRMLPPLRVARGRAGEGAKANPPPS